MNTENNGGKTNYYDLPLPSETEVVQILYKLFGEELSNRLYPANSLHATARQIIALCPQTLNDLIEYKQMAPWQHEIFKATYALHERAKKSKVYSVVREINKIIYYAGRGLAIAMKEQK